MQTSLPKNVDLARALLGANGLLYLIVGAYSILGGALVSGSMITFGVANICAGTIGLVLQQGIAVNRNYALIRRKCLFWSFVTVAIWVGAAFIWLTAGNLGGVVLAGSFLVVQLLFSIPIAVMIRTRF